VKQRTPLRRPTADRRGSPLEKLLNKRIAKLSAWLDRHASYCTEEQAHLDESSRERAYWHYGYLVALTDVRDFIRDGRRLLPRTARMIAPPRSR
jgi:hypothetical protein